MAVSDTLFYLKNFLIGIEVNATDYLIDNLNL
jgi:hypothetical protein